MPETSNKQSINFQKGSLFTMRTKFLSSKGNAGSNPKSDLKGKFVSTDRSPASLKLEISYTAEWKRENDAKIKFKDW